MNQTEGDKGGAVVGDAVIITALEQEGVALISAGATYASNTLFSKRDLRAIVDASIERLTWLSNELKNERRVK